MAPEICSLELTCPGNISVSPDAGSCGAMVTYPAPVVSGDCPGVTVAQTAGLPSGSLFPAGTTTNTFLATSSQGPSATCSFTLTVNSLPGPAGTITGTSSVCQGQGDAAYSVGPVEGATSYSWSYSGTGAAISGNGTSVTISFSASATSGNLTVQGLNSCGTGVKSPNFSILVRTAPLAPVSGGNKERCTGQPVPPLTVTVGAGETADWYADASGGTALATATLSYTPAAAGTFYAEARNLSTGCRSTTRTAVTLTIHPLPSVFAGADQTIPSGTSTTISDATATGAPALSYVWTPAAAFINASLLNPTTLNLTLTTTCTLTVTDGHGCINSDQMTITVSSAVNPGDANCDGFVNVLDIITIVNYIMELNPNPFCFDGADVNNDQVVNVLDVIGSVNIIMTQ
jgi:hypothetical protein